MPLKDAFVKTFCKNMQKNGKIINLFHLLLHIFAYSAMLFQNKKPAAGQAFFIRQFIPEDSLRNYIRLPEEVLR